MKSVSFILLSILWVACSSPEQPIPDFSNCSCERKYEPVCGKDGRTYLNKCYAQCVDSGIAAQDNCPDSKYIESDTLTWKITTYCFPIVRPNEWQLIRELGDGTEIIYDADKDTTMRMFDLRMCICLPPTSLISTPLGQKPLEQLAVGQMVWTLDELGHKQEKSIVRMSKVGVDSTHQLLHLRLADGRELRVSPLHPNAEGKALIEMEEGECLDNSEIVYRELVPYKGRYTMDLLPDGETGLYFANGILIGSTLTADMLANTMK